MGCPELDLRGVVQLAKEHGVNCLELRALAGTSDLPAYFSELKGDARAARDLLRKAGTPARVLGTSFKLVGDDEKGREALIAFARLAEELEAPYLRIFGGGTWGKGLGESEYSEALDVIAWWRALRESNGWQTDILVETHDAFSASPPVLEMFRRLGGGVGLIWDSHHTWRLGGESPAATWKQIGPYVRHVHVKDSVGIPSARHPYTYVDPGTGQMPMGEVMATLRRSGYDGAVSLEWEKMWHPYLSDLGTALGSMSVRGCW